MKVRELRQVDNKEIKKNKGNKKQTITGGKITDEEGKGRQNNDDNKETTEKMEKNITDNKQGRKSRRNKKGETGEKQITR